MRWLARTAPLTLLWLVSAAASAETLTCDEDISDQQSVLSFVSIIDGQPTAPGRPAVSMTYSLTSGEWLLQPALQFAPGKRRGLCDAVISFNLGQLTNSGGDTFQPVYALGWEQRWYVNNARKVTLSTVVATSIDKRGSGRTTASRVMAIAAKSFDHATYYLNVWSQQVSDPLAPNSSDWKPGVLIGAKIQVKDRHAAVLDLNWQRGAAGEFEAGWQWDASDKFTIGPGFSVALSGAREFTVGIAAQYTF